MANDQNNIDPSGEPYLATVIGKGHYLREIQGCGIIGVLTSYDEVVIYEIILVTWRYANK